MLQATSKSSTSAAYSLLSDSDIFLFKPKYGQYPVLTIKLACELWFGAQLSFRHIVKVLRIFYPLLGLELKVPAHTTVRNWCLALAFTHLCQAPPDEIAQSNWALISDESLSIGGKKLLVVLGVPLDRLTNRPLVHQGVRVLTVQMAKSWTGESIQLIYEAIIAKGYTVSYLVSDDGENLAKAARLMSLPRVRDCSHGVATALRRSYKHVADYQNFVAECTRMKRQGVMSDYAYLLPPPVRVQSRFMNLAPLVRWAVNMLKLYDLEELPEEVTEQHRNRLEWLVKYRSFIEQLAVAFTVINPLLTTLKNEHFTHKTIKKCRQLITKGKLTYELKRQLHMYLNDNERVLRQLGVSRVIGCSDVLESMFGKYKHRVGKHIQADCLALVGYGNNFTLTQILVSRSRYRLREVWDWVGQHFKDEVARHRRRVLAHIRTNF